VKAGAALLDVRRIAKPVLNLPQSCRHLKSAKTILTDILQLQVTRFVPRKITRELWNSYI
jgi:hypothetical protein